MIALTTLAVQSAPVCMDIRCFIYVVVMAVELFSYKSETVFLQWST